MAQTAKALDVARVRLVIDDAGRHEERGLECGVVDDVEDRDHRCELGAKAQEHGDKAQMADGGKGEQALEVILEQGNHRAKGHGHKAGCRHDVEPLGRARQNRPHPRHQEKSRLHHGGRVQIGRNGRRRGHGVRQPEMEGELRRFGETAQKDQDQCRQVERGRLDRLLVLQDHAQVIGSCDIA